MLYAKKTAFIITLILTLIQSFVSEITFESTSKKLKKLHNANADRNLIQIMVYSTQLSIHARVFFAMRPSEKVQIDATANI